MFEYTIWTAFSDLRTEESTWVMNKEMGNVNYKMDRKNIW